MKTNANSKMVIVSVLGVLALWGSALADPNVPVGYYVEAYVTGFTHVSDIAFSPGGEFGYKNQLFVLDSRPNSKIYRIPEKGENIFFAQLPNTRVLATSLDFAPIGSEYGPYLFASTEYKLYRYASDGTQQHFANITVFPWEIKFAPDDRFRNNLFLADGWEPSGEAVREFNQYGGQSVLVYTGREETCGLAFGPGGDFGEDLYIAFCYSARSGYPYSAIGRVTPEGVLSEWLVAEDFGYINRLAFDSTGNFKGNLFVTDFLHDVVWEIDPDGNINEFATGFAFSSYSEYAPNLSSSIAFGPDGAMYVSDSSARVVWRIAYIGELDHIEITGPNDVAEDSQTQYKAIAHYDNDSTRDVTGLADWSVEPNTAANIDENGVLTTKDIVKDQSVTILASYTEGDVTVEAEKAIDILAICPTGTALQFDGVDDYVSIPDDESLQLPQTLTIEAWVKPVYDGRDYYADAILVKGQNVGWGPHFNYRILMENSELYTWGVCSSGKELFFHGGTPEYDTWQHLALTADGTVCRAYINGVEVASRDAPGPYLTFPGYPLQIGGHGVTNARWFSGQIDEVRIYNRALSAEEIQANMHIPLQGDEPGLVGYWNFDEETGQIVYDLSGNGNDGRLGSTPNPDVSDPAWVESDAPIGICSLYLIATMATDGAVKRKIALIEELLVALDNEWAAYEALEEWLESGDYGDLDKGDIVTAKQKIHSATRNEEQAIDALEKSIEKLKDALNALGYEPEDR